MSLWWNEPAPNTCWRCGGPCWNADEHPCCKLEDVQPGDTCPSCEMSKRLNKKAIRQSLGKHFR